MDSLRVIQILTEFAYLVLGVAAVFVALRQRERVRVDVALLFGALATTIVLQEASQLTCGTGAACATPEFVTLLIVVCILVLPYALLRLVDDIADVPTWQERTALAAVPVLAIAFAIGGQPPPGWLVTLLLGYLILGTTYAAWAFIARARRTTGMTRRRMAAVAWASGLLALTFIISLVDAQNRVGLLALARITGLISGLCFWAGFFPPAWLIQAWRSPELVEYLRMGRLVAALGERSDGRATDAMALERLASATARTTGARRAFLLL
jgi:hypothetical protein